MDGGIHFPHFLGDPIPALAHSLEHLPHCLDVVAITYQQTTHVFEHIHPPNGF